MMTILIFIIGMIIGSFLNVCINSIPKGESVKKLRLYCSSCRCRLKWADCLPVLSFIFLKGRCRNCGAKLSYQNPLVEVLTGLVFIALYIKFGISIDFIAFSIFMSILIMVLFIDIEHRIIPDELVVSGLVLGTSVFLYNIFWNFRIFGDTSWFNPLLGVLAGSGTLLMVAIIGLIVYRSDDAMGMGDVKLFAPVGMLLGWKMTLLDLFLSVFISGLFSLVLVILRLKKKKDTIPFGPFIVISTFITIMWGWDIFNWYISRI